MRAILLSIVLVLGAMAGCIGNKAAPASDTETPAAIPTHDAAAKTNTTVNATKAPVARITIFAASGAMLFKSSFAAEDPATIVMVDNGSKLNLNAGDSDALEAGATLTSYAWTLDAKPTGTARLANAEINGSGIHLIVLTVTDSNGKSDAQTVKLGVEPKPYDITTNLTTGAVIGSSVAAGTPASQTGTVGFTLAPPNGTSAMVKSVKIVATPPQTCDIALDLRAPDGSSLGHADNGLVGDPEEVDAGAIALATYTIVATPNACVAQDGIPVSVTVTWIPMIPGMPMDSMAGMKM